MNLAFIKKHPVFTLCLGVMALLLIGAGAGLFLSERLYARQAQALDAITARLQQLYRRNPFPVEANVRKEAEDLKDAISRYNELNEFLRIGQVDPQPMEKADFMQYLEKSLRKLRDRLKNAQIKFPEKYSFGFDKYAGGKLPASGDIPRLVQQLKIIEELCDILVEAAIGELVAIERDNFEETARGASSGAAASSSGEGKLISSQHFKISVKAGENAVIAMLNLMAGRPMFMVVTRIEMNNLLQEYGLGGPGAQPAVTTRAPGAPGSPDVPDPVARGRQVILGREELDVKLELKVCQFAPSLAFNEDEKK